MNFRLLSKLLGIIAMLIGVTMLFSLPWAHRAWGNRHLEIPADAPVFEWRAFMALSASVIICFCLGGVLLWLGRRDEGQLFRKEAMAVVGLSWILATVLGALPYYFNQTYRSAGIRLVGPDRMPLLYDFQGSQWGQWIPKNDLSKDQDVVIHALLQAGAYGATATELAERAELVRLAQLSLEDSPASPDRVAIDVVAQLRGLADSDDDWREVLIFPAPSPPSDRSTGREYHYRVRWVPMTFVDCLFESQSGFSTTGATVISDLEDPVLVPHAILFWRSSTHFLGGLGIIVLFVAILGQGSAGKAMMRAEMPGPSKEGSHSRMQHTAWVFAAIYVALTMTLIVILKLFDLTWFDAMCHSFGTMATGGFSTYNASVGHFQSAGIDSAIILFMILAGTNFSLLYLMLRGRPLALFLDVEWRTYALVILAVTLLVMAFGLAHDDFDNPSRSANAGEDGESIFGTIGNALRYGLFQVVAIMTTTGYGTHDFDRWNSFARGVLFLLMFVGGCAGSTGGGMKVIRHILFVKILRLEVEHAFHPTVVRPLRLAGRPVEDPELYKNILVYFGLVLVIFVVSWMFLVTVEPDITWGGNPEHKLIDSASGVAATLNNIGPGLGTVGATQNYGHFSQPAKVLFAWLMMIGRLELFAIVVLFVPSFWRSR
jgi:trk system potassium uptake protein TrkH